MTHNVERHKLRRKALAKRIGGHYPGDTRDDFTDALERYIGNFQTGFFKAEELDNLLRVCGAVWHCTDIMPRDVRQQVTEICGEPEPFTFAQAARRIRAAFPDRSDRET